MPIERNFPTIDALEETPQDDQLDIFVDVPEEEMPPGFEDFEIEGEELEEFDQEPQDFYANLAEYMEEDELEEIGNDILSAVESDKSTMNEWETIFAEGLKLLGFKLRDVESEIFPDSCTVTHPILAESIVKYQAKARSQILRPATKARAKVLGQLTPQKKAKAERVSTFLNYQLDEQMPEYGPEHDRMLFHQAFAGSAYTKIFFDSSKNRPSTKFIKPTYFIIDYNATDLESAYRYTEIIPINGNDLRGYQLDGFYREVDLPGSSGSSVDDIREEINEQHGRSTPDYEDEIYNLYEVYTFLALDNPVVDDRTDRERDIGLYLPYIITVDSDSGKVLSIRRNWHQGDPKYQKRVYHIHWPFIPGFGFQGYGYIHLIGGLTLASTSSLRQLVDAGSFANLQGGFKVHGLRVIGSNEPISPGEWRDVQAPGMDLDKALKPLPYKEPSATLMNLLEFMTMAAQKFADSTEQVVSESTNYGPVGTTMALLEASGRLFSGIHERLFEAQKKELRILMEINSDTLPDRYPFEMPGGEAAIARTDFDRPQDVVPATDPREPTAAHRLARANATLSIAAQFPDKHNMLEVLEDFHSSLGVEHPQRYLIKPNQGKPMDPVTENQLLLMGQPVKSGDYQDHISHIKVHLALMENETYSQNPNIVASAMAHVQEHLAQNFRVEMQKAGVQMPAPGQQLTPEQENQIAVAAAKVAEQMKSRTQENIKQQLEMAEQRRKQRETDLKEKEFEHKRRMDDVDQAQEERFHRDEMAQETADRRTDLQIAREENEHDERLMREKIGKGQVTT